MWVYMYVGGGVGGSCLQRSGWSSRPAEHDLRECGEGGTQSPVRLASAGSRVLISGLGLGKDWSKVDLVYRP